MKKTKSGKRPLVLGLVLAALAVVLVAGTLTWLLVEDMPILSRNMFLANFDAYAEVYFDGSTNPEQYRNADGSISIDFDKDAENKIDKLRVDIHQKGRGAHYIRVKMVESWLDSNGKVLHVNKAIPYNIPSLGQENSWFDNRAEDSSVYLAQKLGGLTASNSVYTKHEFIIEGFDFAAFDGVRPKDSSVSLKVAFIVEAVQVNRFPQFWGIEKLPWED